MYFFYKIRKESCNFYQSAGPREVKKNSYIIYRLVDGWNWNWKWNTGTLKSIKLNFTTDFRYDQPHSTAHASKLWSQISEGEMVLSSVHTLEAHLNFWWRLCETNIYCCLMYPHHFYNKTTAHRQDNSWIDALSLSAVSEQQRKSCIIKSLQSRWHVWSSIPS